MAGYSISSNQLTERAAMRLVCLPFAGGGSAVFYNWRKHIPRQIDLVPLVLPGHDGRLKERPRTNLRVLAAGLAEELRTAMDRPFALLGHSMGGWLAFELARELRHRGVTLPRLLVVAACRPPHAGSPDPLLHELPDDEFLAALQLRYGGIPPEVMSSPQLLRTLLPALRADIAMMETYRFVEEAPLDIEILALGGADDPAVSPAQLESWRRHTKRGCSVRMIPGDHFFLFSDRARRSLIGGRSSPAEPSPAVRTIVARLQQCLAAADSNTTAAKG